MSEPIRGSVAKILDSLHLVINRGSSHGVELGMIFEVLDKNATDIKDPETGKILGSIDRPKIKVKVSMVEKNLSIAKTFETHRVNKGGVGSITFPMTGLLAAPDYVDEIETLKAEDKAWENLSEKDSIVKPGDPVKQILDID